MFMKERPVLGQSHRAHSYTSLSFGSAQGQILDRSQVRARMPQQLEGVLKKWRRVCRGGGGSAHLGLKGLTCIHEQRQRQRREALLDGPPQRAQQHRPQRSRCSSACSGPMQHSVNEGEHLCHALAESGHCSYEVQRLPCRQEAAAAMEHVSSRNACCMHDIMVSAATNVIRRACSCWQPETETIRIPLGQSHLTDGCLLQQGPP